MAEPMNAVDQALKKLADQLECSICLDSFTDPKLLQCCHVFCTNCLEPLVLQDQQGLSLCCPKCRHSTPIPANGVSGLQPAFHVHHFFEIRDALQKVKQEQEGRMTMYDKRQANGFCRDCTNFLYKLQPLPSTSICRQRVLHSTAGRMKCCMSPLTDRGNHQKVSQLITSDPFTCMSQRKFEAPSRTITGLNGPWGVTVSEEGQIIIAEGGGHCISICSPSGEKVKSFGVQGSAPGQFLSPRGVAVDRAGNILVVDGDRIQKFTNEGNILRFVGGRGDSPYQFFYPVGIGISPGDKVYICDAFNHRVQILNPNLTFLASFGSKGSGDGQFDYPWGVAFDSQGNVYITDSNNHRIQIFIEDGHFLRKFGKRGGGNGELNRPLCIAINSSDIVCIGERDNHRISLFTREGCFLRAFGTRGEGPEQFNWPYGLAFSKENHVYICDLGNHRLQIW